MKLNTRKTPCLPTFSTSDGHEGFEKPRLFSRHRHDLDPRLDAVEGIHHQPQARPPETTAEHDWGHTFIIHSDTHYTLTNCTSDVWEVKANVSIKREKMI